MRYINLLTYLHANGKEAEESAKFRVWVKVPAEGTLIFGESRIFF